VTPSNLSLSVHRNIHVLFVPAAAAFQLAQVPLVLQLFGHGLVERVDKGVEGALRGLDKVGVGEEGQLAQGASTEAVLATLRELVQLHADPGDVVGRVLHVSGDVPLEQRCLDQKGPLSSLSI